MTFDLLYRPDLLRGRRILVTGGGSGIGRALATAYAQLGAAIYIAGRRGEVLDRTASEIAADTGASVQGIVCDVRDPEAVEAMLERIWADGALTGLVNSAAGNFIAPTERVSVRGFNTVTDIQFRGAFYVTNGCGQRWIAAGQPGNVVSIVANDMRVAGPFHVPAMMAKAGVVMMTQSLAVEWARYGIRLNAIAPGVFRTDSAASRLDPLEQFGWSASANPMRRVGELGELANLGVFLMADGLGFLTGETVTIDGAATRANGATFGSLLSMGPDAWDSLRAAPATARTPIQAGPSGDGSA